MPTDQPTIQVITSNLSLNLAPVTDLSKLPETLDFGGETLELMRSRNIAGDSFNFYGPPGLDYAVARPILLGLKPIEVADAPPADEVNG